MTGNLQPQVIKHIVEQHAEEAAFLWILRDDAIRQPHYKLHDIADLDKRVDAHIDGLRIAGDPGWEICEAALELEEAGEVFTAAVLAFESENSGRVDTVIRAGCVSEETYRGLVSALGWIADSHWQRWSPGMLSSSSNTYRRLAVCSCAVRRQDPGEALLTELEDHRPYFRARVLRAIGELKRQDLLPALQTHFKSDDPGCQFWSAWSALLLGDRSGLEIVKAYASKDTPFRDCAIQIAVRVMKSKEVRPWLKELYEDPDSVASVITASGAAGISNVIPWLIRRMDKPELARAAGQAFSMITGVDLAYENMERECPEGFKAGPTENPEDTDVEMDQEEDMPWPEPQLIGEWWEKNKKRYETGIRYLCGEPITVRHCQHVLRTGYQPQRRAAAFELALLQSNQPLFNTSIPGNRQFSLLSHIQ